MRGQLRTIVAAAVIVVIVIALFVESPGTVEGIGLGIILLAMVFVVLQERRKPR